MSKIGDAIITGEELFQKAREKYEMFDNFVRNGVNTTENACKRAFWLGELVAYAKYNEKIFGDEELRRIVEQEMNIEL